MSIATQTEWDIRTTGAGTNGSGFKDLNPGTSVDYSQQDAAQLALTDIASDVGGTGVSSATGGFTAAMEGNCMYITGTGFTTGWYQITGYTDTNNITIDRSCGASASGGVGNVGGAFLPSNSDWTLFFSTTNKSGYNITWMEAGTYTGIQGASILTIAATYHRLRGYNTAHADEPTIDDRPLLEIGNNACYIGQTGGYSWIENLRINSIYSSSTTAMVYYTGTAGVLRNCKVTRSGYAGAYAVRLAQDHCRVLSCELSAANGKALQFQNAENCIVDFNFIHDSADGVTFSGASSYSAKISNCVVANCTTNGIYVYFGGTISGNTVYNCGTGIKFNSLYSAAYSNIIKDCTTGISGSELTYDDSNCFHGNATERTGGIVAGVNNITSDPLLVDPGNDDYRLGASSPCFNIGVKLGANVGL
jgi:hypothetical protein